MFLNIAMRIVETADMLLRTGKIGEPTTVEKMDSLRCSLKRSMAEFGT